MEIVLVRVNDNPPPKLRDTGVVAMVDAIISSEGVPIMRVNDIMIRESKNGYGREINGKYLYVSDGVLMRSSKDGTPMKDKENNYLYAVKFYDKFCDSILDIYEKLNTKPTIKKKGSEAILQDKEKTEKDKGNKKI